MQYQILRFNLIRLGPMLALFVQRFSLMIMQNCNWNKCSFPQAAKEQTHDLISQTTKLHAERFVYHPWQFIIVHPYIYKLLIFSYCIGFMDNDKHIIHFIITVKRCKWNYRWRMFFWINFNWNLMRLKPFEEIEMDLWAK